MAGGSFTSWHEASTKVRLPPPTETGRQGPYLPWWSHFKEMAPRSLSKLMRDLFSFKNDLHTFQRDRERTYKSSSVNTLRKKGEHRQGESLPLFTTGRIKPFNTFNLYLPLLSTLGEHLLMCTKENMQELVHCSIDWIDMQKN